MTIPLQCISFERKEYSKENLFERVAGESVMIRIINEKLAYDKGQKIISQTGSQIPPLLFDAVHGLGFYLKDPPHEVNQAYDNFFVVLEAFKILCDRHKVRFIVALFPQRFQIQERDWKETSKGYQLKENCFDLNEPNRRIAEFCRNKNILCLDPSDEMKQYHQKCRKSLYLPLGDMHWNQLGHKACYLGLRKELFRVVEDIMSDKTD